MEKRKERREQKFLEKKRELPRKLLQLKESKKKQVQFFQPPFNGRASLDPETERCWRKSRLQSPFPEAEIVAPATPEIYLPDQEWPEEPGSIRRVSGSRRIRGRWGRSSRISHLRNSSSTSFQRLISSHLTSRKINPKRKHRSSEYPHFGRNLCKL